MADSNSGASGGIGFVGLLTIAFIVLKLCDVIDWSWWWVFSPLWISTLAAIGIFLFLVTLIFGVRGIVVVVNRLRGLI